jgi:CRISPR/Cas system-associated exonuclease Cas4 (RecB family)
MNELMTTITVNILVPAAVAVGTALAARAVAWVNSKITNEKVRDAVLLVEDRADTVVRALQQEVVVDLKKRSADGKLSEQDIAQITDTALKQIKSTVPDTALNYLQNNTVDVNTLILTTIKSAVSRQKRGML